MVPCLAVVDAAVYKVLWGQLAPILTNTMFELSGRLKERFSVPMKLSVIVLRDILSLPGCLVRIGGLGSSTALTELLLVAMLTTQCQWQGHKMLGLGADKSWGT